MKIKYPQNVYGFEYFNLENKLGIIYYDRFDNCLKTKYYHNLTLDHARQIRDSYFKLTGKLINLSEVL